MKSLRLLAMLTAGLLGCGSFPHFAVDASTDVRADIPDTATPDLGGMDLPAALDTPSDTPMLADAGVDAVTDAVADVHTGAGMDVITDAPVDTAVEDALAADAPPAVPRLIAPLSGATVSTNRPTLRWLGGAGHIEICSEASCTTPEVTYDPSGSALTLSASLSAGLHFWHWRPTGGAYTPTWEFRVGTRSAAVSNTWGGELDINGDGYTDLAVGTSSASRFYVYMGGDGGVSTTAVTIGVPHGGNECIASAGDVNGDGYADVIVGAVDDAWVYPGSADGLTIRTTHLSGTTGSGFGTGVAGAGDVNGDGYADVIVGAPMAGTAFVYYGSASGVGATPTTLTGPTGSTDFGYSVGSAGDLNADGYGDVVVGGLGDTAYIYLGSAMGPTGMPTTETAAASAFGYSVGCAGDVDGDGYSDVMIGSDYDIAYVYPGSRTGVSSSPYPLTGASGSQFGFSVAGTGDINGDGYDDILVTDTGHAYVYFGGASGLSPTASATLTAASGDALKVAGGGDFNRDGFADFVLGDYMANTASVYAGSGAGPSAMPTMLGVAGEGFGWALAFNWAWKRVPRSTLIAGG